MKNNADILQYLRKCREARKQIDEYLDIISTIKTESNRIPLKTMDSNKQYQKTTDSLQEPYEYHKQITFASPQERSIDLGKVRDFISKYEQMLSCRESIAENQVKLNFQSETIEDIFRLSTSQRSDSLIQSKFINTNPSTYDYDTSNFGHDKIRKFQSECFNDYYEQQIKESLMQLDQKINENDFDQQKTEKKSFDQFYQEYVEEEVHNLSQEIQEMQKFLQKVQTAKNKLSLSVQDLQQITTLNTQNSQQSIEKVNQDLENIEYLRSSMEQQIQCDKKNCRIKELRYMKSQIQKYFNKVESELIKLNEDQIKSV